LRRAEALRAINCNKGLQPFADADKVQKFNTLCFPFNLEKRHKQRIYQLNPKILKKNLLFSKNNLHSIYILLILILSYLSNIENLCFGKVKIVNSKLLLPDYIRQQVIVLHIFISIF